MILDMEQVMREDAILKVMVTDLSGGFKEIISHISRLKEICQVGMAYDGSSFVGINPINDSDSILLGVPETLVKVPQKLADSDKPEYMIICNIVATDNSPHPNCARSQLVRLQQELGQVWDQGRMFMGSEPEAYFVSREGGYSEDNMPGGNSNYFNPRDPRSKIITEIVNALDEMGFEVERAHTEVGKEQFETNWKFDRAERTADKTQYYKLIAHKIANLHGYDVTFLPKPYPNRNGSGMHCHISVQNISANLFYDDQGNNNFSTRGLQFITGILNHARSLTAIANPTEVSYSRLVPGFEAPVLVAVSPSNRSATCRIPVIADKELQKKAIRAEFRFPDPLANPYLLAAGFIAAGLDGIEKNMEFGGFTNLNLYELSPAEIEEKKIKLLPRNLWESFQEYIKDDSLAWKLGPMHKTHGEIILEEINECQRYANTHSMSKHYLD